jgi:diguanylate cyclase (GGDEF)-like protein
MRREHIDFEYLLRSVLPLAHLPEENRREIERALQQGSPASFEDLARRALETLCLSGVLCLIDDRDEDGERLVRYANVLDASTITLRLRTKRCERGIVKIPTPFSYWSSKTSIPVVRKILSLGDQILARDDHPMTGMNEVLETFVEAVREIIGADHAALVFAAETLDTLRYLEAISSPQPFDRPLTEEVVIGERQMVSVTDLLAYPGGHRMTGFRSLAIVAISSSEPPVRGAVEVWSRTPGFFDEERLALLGLLAEQGSGLIEKSARLSRLVFFDPLTQVYNRAYFNVQLHNEIARARREDKPLALVIADVDDFKQFNSRFGYSGGNEVLKAVAQILLRSVRPFDLVTRWGGEEFALVLTAPVNREAAGSVCERLRAAVAATPFRLMDMAGVLRAAELSISIGVSMYPAEADSGEPLWNRANRALLVAKERGKNRVVFASDAPSA